jgi:hypothetical protein
VNGLDWIGNVLEQLNIDPMAIGPHGSIGHEGASKEFGIRAINHRLPAEL